MRTRTALLLAAGFAAGVIAARLTGPPSARAQSQHVYELRTYTTAPGRLEALKKRFRDHTTRIFENHGMRNVGYWVPADGLASDNTLIYILEHDTRDAARKSWDDFRNDPEWKKVQAESEADGKIVEKVVSVFMIPTDFSQLK
jgi:NIPSNAP